MKQPVASNGQKHKKIRRNVMIFLFIGLLMILITFCFMVIKKTEKKLPQKPTTPQRERSSSEEEKKPEAEGEVEEEKEEVQPFHMPPINTTGVIFIKTRFPSCKCDVIDQSFDKNILLKIFKNYKGCTAVPTPGFLPYDQELGSLNWLDIDNEFFSFTDDPRMQMLFENYSDPLKSQKARRRMRRRRNQLIESQVMAENRILLQEASNRKLERESRKTN
ncbi:hypothetical protein NUSPORA_00546 [Nucleospora cyclopteri]